MTARWANPPTVRKPAGRRQKPLARSVYRCQTCGESLTGAWAAAERHADAHGGARLELDL